MDEPAVLTKLFLDLVVMKEGQGNGCLANTTSSNERNGCEVCSKANNLFNQLITPKAGQWWGREFSRRDTRGTYKSVGYMMFKITNLA